MKNEGTLPELQEMTDRLLSQELSPLPSVADLQLRNRRRHRRRLAFRSLTVASAAAAVAVVAALAVPAGDAPSPHWALAGDITSAWRQVPGIGPMSGLSLTCPSASTCYAEGPGSVDPGSVEVTRDGGKTWQPAPTKGETPLSNVACSSTRECAFLEAPLSGKPVLVETADAGKTWASRPGPPGLSGDSIGSIALSCPSASTCTVVASSFQQTGTSGAFVTEDGGQTWSASPMPTAAPSQVQCFPNARCISTGAGAPGGPWAPATARTVGSTGRRPSSLRSPVGPSGLSPFRAVAQRCVWPCRCLTARRGPPLPSPATGASPGRQSRPRGCRQARCSRAWPARPPRCAGCRAIPRCTSPMAK